MPDLQILSVMGYFKKINAFLFYALYLEVTAVHDKSIGLTENTLERDFSLAKLCVNKWPLVFFGHSVFHPLVANKAE